MDFEFGNLVWILFPVLTLNVILIWGLVLARKKHIEERMSLRRRLFEEYEASKDELARDVHDEFGVVKAKLYDAMTLADVSDTTKAKLSRVVVEFERQLNVLTLATSPIAEGELLLSEILEPLEELYVGRTPQFFLSCPEDIAVNSFVGKQIFRIVQEALSNARRYSDSKYLDVMVETEAGHLVVEIHREDRDRPHRPDALHQGIGQLVLKERLQRLGGGSDTTTSNSEVVLTIRIPQA